MKTLKRLLVAAILWVMFAPVPLLAQFSISGEFRPRFEYRDGYLKLRDSSQTPYPAILGRTRLIFDYSGNGFTAKFSVQHAYTYGENNYGSDTITRNTLNIHEGWFRYEFSKGFAFKIGRMELVYDDGRLLGNSNWSPRATYHDAAILQWKAASAGYRGDFGFAINNTAPPGAYLSSYPLRNYKYMAYLYEQKTLFGEKLTLSMLAFLDVLQKPSSTASKTTTSNDTLYVVNPAQDTIGMTVLPVTTTTKTTTSYPDQLYGRFTIGGTAGYAAGNLKLFGAGYYQTGHFSNGKKISAWFAGGYASYKVLKPLTLLAGYEYVSGNDYSDTQGNKTRSTSFSTLYPNAHGFYGYMDMFGTQVTNGNSAGLTDLYARATVAVTKKANLEATWRMFGLARGYLPVTPAKPGDPTYIAVGKNLGSEIDMMAVYKPVAGFEINAAYCFFLPTSSMERLNGLQPGTSEWAQYAYVMLTWKPVFFTTAKP